MKKAAIIRRNGLGDLLCTFPLILYLQKQGFEVTLFASERNAKLLPYLPKVDHVVVLPTQGNKYLSHLKAALSYRKYRYDLAISAKTSPMKLVNIFLFVLGAKKRVAYVEKAWHSHLINQPLPYDQKEHVKKHQALKTLQMIAPELESIPSDLYPKITLPPELLAEVTTTLAQGMPLLLLSGSTTRPSSRFNEIRYAALVNRLYKEHPHFFTLIIAEKKDEFRSLALKAELKVPSHLLFPRSFTEFVGLIGLADTLFVGDGGISHIGGALGKKGVVLFGESHPVQWAPLGGGLENFYDPIHVNRLSDEKIYEALKRKVLEKLEMDPCNDYRGGK